MLFKDIKGYEGLYQITDTGKVYSLRYKRFIYTSTDRYGYEQCLLYKNGKHKTKKVHRLVAEHFIPNPENKSQINHKDGIRDNNDLRNLEWATNSENQYHSYKHNGRVPSNGYYNKRTRKLEQALLTIKEKSELTIKMSTDYVEQELAKEYLDIVNKALGDSNG